MRHALPIALAAALAGCGSARNAPAAAPSPSTAPALSAEASIVATERAFADSVASAGIRAAFLHFADDSAISFGPEPVSTKAAWQSRPNASVGLAWYPAFVRAAASGDLAISTGPYTLADSAGTPIGWGTFFTVWKRRADGWRFVMDQGIQHPRPDAAPAPLRPSATGPAPAVAAENAEAVASLLAADNAFAAQARSSGFAAALDAWAAPEMRWLRPRAQPHVGRAAALAAATADSARRYTAMPMRAFASAAGDLGWSWGEYESVHPGAGRRESGHYVRAWTREGTGPWRLLLSVDSPRPTERDE